MLRWLLVLAHVSFAGGMSMAAAASEDTLATDQGPIGISWVIDPLATTASASRTT